MLKNEMLLPGNLDLMSQILGGPFVPLVCSFIRRGQDRLSNALKSGSNHK